MDKRTAVLTGARAVFARDGFSRASIDVIAAEANVSSRTIYNHFQDKAGLFYAVLLESAGRVAAVQIEILDRHLGRITDLEADLVAFGVAWRTSVPDFAEHQALVRQVIADAQHIPPAAIEAWQQAGPLAVRRALADRFAALASDGLLTVDDPLRAALHYSVLISGDTVNPYPAKTENLDETVATGVHAFLHGYGRP
ncbi:TetR family transcriptional regulator [Kribbella sp. VKM Ac-2527]|uniref:TetR family transcriptional regulator n=1 Tax=Kribbella caucasensis TaxID=2512215 RepID=A0A4R6KQD9_9ACTN|nr:TetR/AcrR family transcriptional regulator [Kribbella sp. VKM Ac-2527]TDO54916.1 TetR family transcriptional regulator [Kribbella sp. VKM Ac-2527]